MRLAIATIAALIAAGCSTTPATVESARPVPADRIFETTSGESSVTFLRDSGGYGAACTHTVYVNNVRTFAMRSNESHMIRVPAGDYVFRLDTGGGLCPNVSTSQDAAIREGQGLVYRVLLPSDGSLRLTRIE